MKVLLGDGAEGDLIEIVAWLEEEQSGTGRLFKEELLACVSAVEIFPLMHPEIRSGIRRAVLKRYRYAVYYKVESDQVEILEIVHTSRKRDHWEIREICSSWMLDPDSNALKKGIRPDDRLRGVRRWN